jgi:hypothetical protein
VDGTDPAFFIAGFWWRMDLLELLLSADNQAATEEALRKVSVQLQATEIATRNRCQAVEASMERLGARLDEIGQGMNNHADVIELLHGQVFVMFLALAVFVAVMAVIVWFAERRFGRLENTLADRMAEDCAVFELTTSHGAILSMTLSQLRDMIKYTKQPAIRLVDSPSEDASSEPTIESLSTFTSSSSKVPKTP